MERIRFRTLALLGVSAILLFSFGLVMLLTVRSYMASVREQELQYTEAYLNNATREFNTFCERLERVTRFLFYDEALMKTLQTYNQLPISAQMEATATFENALTDVLYLREEDIVTIALLDAQEEPVYQLSSLHGFDVFPPLLRNAEVKQVLLREVTKRSTGAIAYGYFSMEWVAGSYEHRFYFPTHFLFAARKIRTFYPREDVGYIIAAAPVSAFDKLLAGESMTDRTLLLDPNHQITYDSAGGLEGKMLETYAPGLSALLVQGSNFETYIGDVHTLVSHRESSVNGWTLVSLRDYDDVFWGSFNLSRANILIFTMAFLIIIVLISLYVYYITLPLKMLVKQLSKTHLDNLDEELAETGSWEFVQLARSYNKMLRKINAMLESEYKAVIRQREFQIALLRAQIKPHFLYNTLDAIRMVAVISNDREAADMILMLSEFFRSSIVDVPSLPLREEFSQVSSYISLLKIRHEEIRDEIFLDDTISHLLVPNFILQPLVENAINHGLKPNRYKGTIRVWAVPTPQGGCELAVADDGVGLSHAELEHLNTLLSPNAPQDEGSQDRSDHIGLINVWQRLYAFFGNRVRFELSTPPQGGLCVRIIILPEGPPDEDRHGLDNKV